MHTAGVELQDGVVWGSRHVMEGAAAILVEGPKQSLSCTSSPRLLAGGCTGLVHRTTGSGRANLPQVCT